MKGKTSDIKGNTPIWNDNKFFLNIKYENEIELLIFDKKIFTKDVFIGSVHICLFKNTL